MHLLRFSLISLFVLLMSAIAPAQKLRLFGKVVQDPKTNKFMIACTKIRIESTTIDLSKLGPGVQEMFGTNKGTFTNPVIDITSVSASSSRFAMTGSGRIGSKFIFTGVAGMKSLFFIVWASLQPSYLPLDPHTPTFSGTWYLHPTWLVFINVVQVIQGVGLTDLRIPNNKVYIGLPFHSQGALWPATLPIVLLNPDCNTIKKAQ